MAEAEVNGTAVEHPLPASAAALARFQLGRAADAPERPDAPVYLVRVATGELDSAILMAQATAGIVKVTPQHYRDAILIGLEEAHAKGHVSDEDYATYSAVYDDFLSLDPWDAAEGPEPRERKILAARFRTLQDYIAEISPRYQQLAARAVTNLVREKALVCQFVLAGWEQRDDLCVIQDKRVLPECIATLTEVEQMAIAAFYDTTRGMTEAQKKTSASPSPSPASPSVSPSASSGRRTGRRGKSAPTSTEPTPDT